MRKIATLVAFAACTIAAPALANDEDGSWTGAYVGVNVGYTDATTDQTAVIGGSWTSESTALQSFVAANYPSQLKAKDVSFGGQIGYNMQAGSGLVVGLEADVSVLSGKESSTRALTPPSIPGLTYTVTNSFDPSVNYSVRGKLGFASGNTLFYATGGWGWAKADIDLDISSTGNYHKTANLSHTFDGYEIGGGIEQRFGSNMSVRLEYIYTDKGDVTYSTVYAPGSAFAPPALNYTETFTQDYRAHYIRLGVNMHF